MKILVSITSGSNNTERNILRAFYDGIEKYYFEKFGIDSHKPLKKQHGIDLRMSYDPEIEKCDVAVQFGTVKDRNNEHHVTKQSIARNAKKIIYVETPLLGRVINKSNDYSFYRVGVNGFLNNDGVFYNEELLDQNRLDFLKSQTTIPSFPGWKNSQTGDILVLLQLPGDASLRGQKMSEWLSDTVDQIRALTDRKINIRLHPAMSEKGRAELFGELVPLFLKNYNNISWNDGTEKSLEEDLGEAGLCVSYTSGSCIDAVLAGVPVIALDEGNLAYPISSHRIDEINSPRLVSVETVKKWLIALANSQWSEKEMLTGTVWNHIVSILNEIEKNNDENSSHIS